jgi:hypothetical protein
MAFNAHVAEHRITAGVIAGAAFGIKQGILVDADLTTAAAAKAAVDADVAKLHVSQALFGARVKASIDRADTYKSGYTTGSAAASVYSIEDLNRAISGLALRF